MTRVPPEPYPSSPRYTRFSFFSIFFTLVSSYMLIPDRASQFELNADPPVWPAVFVSVAHMRSCVYVQMANLADADVSEEDKIKVMINQSTYDSMKWVTSAVLSHLLLHPRFCLLSTSVCSFSLLAFITLLHLHPTLHIPPLFSAILSLFLIQYFVHYSFFLHVHISLLFCYFLSSSTPPLILCLFLSVVTTRSLELFSLRTTPVIAVEILDTTSGTVPPAR